MSDLPEMRGTLKEQGRPLVSAKSSHRIEKYGRIIRLYNRGATK